MKVMRSASKILFQVFCFVLILQACSSSTNSSDDEVELELLELDVRVHLLTSQESAGLNTIITEEDIPQLFNGVNEVWSQASVRWNVESVITETALNGTQFDRMLRGEIPPSATILRSVIPRDSLTDGKWDVFLIHDFGGFAGGIYFPDIPAVLQPDTDPTGISGFQGGLIRILSHELGHSLSLVHVPCLPSGNLMAPGCPQGVRTRLVDGQIEASRNQALTGEPADNL